MSETAQRPRLYVLRRDTDTTGYSGTGDVADIVEWPDGTVSMRWRGPERTFCNGDSLAQLATIHGHNGASRIVALPDLASDTGDENIRGCSCGNADYGAPGHDGDPNDESSGR